MTLPLAVIPVALLGALTLAVAAGFCLVMAVRQWFMEAANANQSS